MDSKVFLNETALKIWIWLLFTARHVDGFAEVKIGNNKSIVDLQRGQLLTGRKKASEKLKVKQGILYKWLQKFKSWNMIDINSNNHFSIITICNYDYYNPQKDDEEQPGNSQGTAREQPGNTNNNYNNYKNGLKNKGDENLKKIYPDKLGEKIRENTIKPLKEIIHGHN